MSKRMIACICVELHETIYKAVWVTESSKGVYVGVFGSQSGTHVSYHRDGVVHFKLVGSDLPHCQHKRCPIETVSSFVQISHLSIPLSETQEAFASSVYAGRDTVRSVVFLPKDLFFESEHIHVDVFLVKNGSETELLHDLSARAEPHLAACELIRSEKFPNHSIGMALSV